MRGPACRLLQQRCTSVAAELQLWSAEHTGTVHGRAPLTPAACPSIHLRIKDLSYDIHLPNTSQPLEIVLLFPDVPHPSKPVVPLLTTGFSYIFGNKSFSLTLF